MRMHKRNVVITVLLIAALFLAFPMQLLPRWWLSAEDVPHVMAAASDGAGGTFDGPVGGQVRLAAAKSRRRLWPENCLTVLGVFSLDSPQSAERRNTIRATYGTYSEVFHPTRSVTGRIALRFVVGRRYLPQKQSRSSNSPALTAERNRRLQEDGVDDVVVLSDVLEGVPQQGNKVPGGPHGALYDITTDVASLSRKTLRWLEWASVTLPQLGNGLGRCAFVSKVDEDVFVVVPQLALALAHIPPSLSCYGFVARCSIAADPAHVGEFLYTTGMMSTVSSDVAAVVAASPRVRQLVLDENLSPIRRQTAHWKYVLERVDREDQMVGVAIWASGLPVKFFQDFRIIEPAVLNRSELDAGNFGAFLKPDAVAIHKLPSELFPAARHTHYAFSGASNHSAVLRPPSFVARGPAFSRKSRSRARLYEQATEYANQSINGCGWAPRWEFGPMRRSFARTPPPIWPLATETEGFVQDLTQPAGTKRVSPLPPLGTNPNNDAVGDMDIVVLLTPATSAGWAFRMSLRETWQTLRETNRAWDDDDNSNNHHKITARERPVLRFGVCRQQWSGGYSSPVLLAEAAATGDMLPMSCDPNDVMSAMAALVEASALLYPSSSNIWLVAGHQHSNRATFAGEKFHVPEPIPASLSPSLDSVPLIADFVAYLPSKYRYLVDKACTSSEERQAEKTPEVVDLAHPALNASGHADSVVMMTIAHVNGTSRTEWNREPSASFVWLDRRETSVAQLSRCRAVRVQRAISLPSPATRPERRYTPAVEPLPMSLATAGDGSPYCFISPVHMAPSKTPFAPPTSADDTAQESRRRHDWLVLLLSFLSTRATPNEAQLHVYAHVSRSASPTSDEVLTAEAQLRRDIVRHHPRGSKVILHLRKHLSANTEVRGDFSRFALAQAIVHTLLTQRRPACSYFALLRRGTFIMERLMTVLPLPTPLPQVVSVAHVTCDGERVAPHVFTQTEESTKNLGHAKGAGSIITRMHPTGAAVSAAALRRGVVRLEAFGWRRRNESGWNHNISGAAFGCYSDFAAWRVVQGRGSLEFKDVPQPVLAEMPSIELGGHDHSRSRQHRDVAAVAAASVEADNTAAPPVVATPLICVAVRTHVQQRLVLETTLRSLVYAASVTSGGVKVFVIHTAPFTDQRWLLGILSQFPSDVVRLWNQTATSLSSLDPFGYKLTDQWMRDVGNDSNHNHDETSTGNCDFFLVTNGDNFYMPTFFARVRSAIRNGKRLVATHFATRYRRGGVAARFQLFHIDLGAVVFSRSLWQRVNVTWARPVKKFLRWSTSDGTFFETLAEEATEQERYIIPHTTFIHQ